MTIEEMQTVWSEMTDKIEQQKRLTDNLIIEMTQQKFRDRITTISRYESAGALVCFILALGIILFMDRLDTWYLSTLGILVASYLILVPMIVLRSIKRMKSINIDKSTMKQSLLEFTSRRRHFLLLQRLFIGFNLVFILMVLPVARKILKNEDLFLTGQAVWWWYVPLMLLFLIPFSIWGYRGYRRITDSAQRILEDL